MEIPEVLEETKTLLIYEVPTKDNDKDCVSAKSLAVSIFIFLVFLFLLRKFKTGKCKSNVLYKTVDSSKTPISHVNHFGIPLPWIDGIYSLYQLKTRGVKQLEEWGTKYGNIYEIPVGFQSIVVIADPRMIEKLLASKDSHHLSKPRYYTDKLFLENFSKGLLNTDYELWINQRRRSQPGFSYRSQQSSLSYLNTYSRNFANALLPEDSAEQIYTVGVDKLWKMVDALVIKLVTHFVIGSANCSDSKNAKFFQDFTRFQKFSNMKLFNPQFNLYWHFSSSTKRYYEKLRKSIEDHIEEIVNTARANQDIETEKDEIQNANCVDKPYSSLIEAMIVHGASNQEIQDEVGTFFAAGYETMVRAIQMLLVHLGINHDEQRQCREEVDKLLDLSGDTVHGGNLNMTDLSNLKHLERCTLESLRLTPPVAAFLRRLDTPLEISENLVLKAGTNVAIPPWTVHRDLNNFPNPTKFDSGRFLTENVRNRHPYAFIPFSGGQRNCIGYKLAIMQIKVVVAHVLRRFEINVADNLDDVTFLFDSTIKPVRNYKITLRKRV